MRIIILLLVLFLFMPTVYCSPSESSVLSSFQTIVTKYLESIESDSRILVYYVEPNSLIKSTGGWIKSKCSIAESSFDVQKTNSLVSPFIGIINYKLYIHTTKYNLTQEKAKEDDNFNNPGRPYAVRVHFAYQSEKWVPTKYACAYDEEWFEIKEGHRDRIMFSRIKVLPQ